MEILRNIFGRKEKIPPRNVPTAQGIEIDPSVERLQELGEILKARGISVGSLEDYFIKSGIKTSDRDIFEYCTIISKIALGIPCVLVPVLDDFTFNQALQRIYEEIGDKQIPFTGGVADFNEIVEGKRFNLGIEVNTNNPQSAEFIDFADFARHRSQHEGTRLVVLSNDPPGILGELTINLPTIDSR